MPVLTTVKELPVTPNGSPPPSGDGLTPIDPTGWIVTSGALVDGKPCIRGTGLTVEAILQKLAGGMTAAEIVRDYPRATPENVAACLEFAAGAVNAFADETRGGSIGRETLVVECPPGETVHVGNAADVTVAEAAGPVTLHVDVLRSTGVYVGDKTDSENRTGKALFLGEIEDRAELYGHGGP